MNSFFEWMMHTAQISADKLYGMAALLFVLILVLGIGVLRHRAAFLVGCIVRLVSGAAAILLVNALLRSYHIDVLVGLNAISLLTSAILGIPGVCLLYALLYL